MGFRSTAYSPQEASTLRVPTSSLSEYGTISVKTFGGKGAGATTVEGFDTWVQEAGGNAVPLSYKLSYMQNHTVAGVSLTSTYVLRFCQEISFRHRFRLTVKSLEITVANDHGSASNPEEVYGKIFVTGFNSIHDTVPSLAGVTSLVYFTNYDEYTSVGKGQKLEINQSREFECRFSN